MAKREFTYRNINPAFLISVKRWFVSEIAILIQFFQAFVIRFSA